MSELEFHSKNIADTKAKEKREIFVKVEEKKTIKQSAEEFQKKFAEAKAHAAETRAKIENPGADENGVIRSSKHFEIPTKLILKIVIPISILGIIAFVIYLNWDKIHHEFFEVSESRAAEILAENPQKAITMYDKLLDEEPNDSVKATKYLLYAEKLDSLCYVGCDSSVLTKIKTYIESSETLAPSYASANLMYSYEINYGTDEAAAKWEIIMNEREATDKTGGLGDG